MGITGLGLIILNYVAMWMLFKKAGEEGWKGLIPFYNEYIYCKLANCIKLFWADLILSIVLYSGAAFIFVTGMIASFGSLLGYHGDFGYTLYNILGATMFTLVPFVFIALFVTIAKTILKIFINLKFVSCFTDEIVFKVLAGIGSFSPFFVTLVVTRSIIGFGGKYNYTPPVVKEDE